MHTSEMIEQLKQALWIIFTGIVSMFCSILGFMILLAIGFIFNFLVGMTADRKLNDRGFDQDKAFKAIKHLGFFFATIVFLSIGAVLIKEESYGEFGAKWLTCVVVYFYLTNIFRNAHLMDPQNETIKFIYELLTTEIFGRLKEMIGIKNKKDTEL